MVEISSIRTSIVVLVLTVNGTSSKTFVSAFLAPRQRSPLPLPLSSPLTSSSSSSSLILYSQDYHHDDRRRNLISTLASTFSMMGERAKAGTTAGAAAAATVSRPLLVKAQESSPFSEGEAGNDDQFWLPNIATSIYQIKPDASPNLEPELLPLSSRQFENALAGTSMTSSAGGAIWLGEHHNSASDHLIQANIIQQIYNERKQTSASGMPRSPNMAIGLEQVQIQFQSSLDDYISCKITEEQLLEQIDWEKRWFWPFQVYRPIFQLARQLQIPLVALNANSEDLAMVEVGGYPNLPKQRMKYYIRDPVGFASMMQSKSYSTYVNYVIEPSYRLHQQMGLLQNTISGQRLETPMTFGNFLSGRLLWDECMAAVAREWIVDHSIVDSSQHPPLIIGLVGADHVKFVNGIPGRFARMSSLSSSSSPSPNESYTNISIMINPTLIDTRPSGSLNQQPMTPIDNAIAMSSQYPEQITLQLRYLKENVSGNEENDGNLSLDNIKRSENTGGVLPLADYIVVGR